MLILSRYEINRTYVHCIHILILTHLLVIKRTSWGWWVKEKLLFLHNFLVLCNFHLDFRTFLCFIMFYCEPGIIHVPHEICNISSFNLAGTLALRISTERLAHYRDKISILLQRQELGYFLIFAYFDWEQVKWGSFSSLFLRGLKPLSCGMNYAISDNGMFF
jgi:hypothetical protein